MTPFSTKNGTLFMGFGRSFTGQWHFWSLKMQNFENWFQSASS